jgi:hypothetical protein
MEPLQQPQELDLNFLVPNVFADGQVYSLPNDNTKAPATISFIQMRPPKSGKPHADVVASVSFPNIDAMKKFVTDVQKQIDQHEKRER